MKIERIAVYRVELPLVEGSYNWSGGKSVSVFDSTVVRVETDDGPVGHGEVCPLGPSYLPAYASGARAGIAELGPHLIGELYFICSGSGSYRRKLWEHQTASDRASPTSLKSGSLP